MTSMKSLLLAAVATTALVAGSASAATIVIDRFITEQYVVAVPPTGDVSMSEVIAPSASAVGGYRYMRVSNNHNRLNGTSLATGDGYLDFSNASRTTGTGTITWNGPGLTGLGGLDITDGGTNDAVFFDVIFADSDISMAFSLTDTSGRRSVFNALLSEELSDPQSVIFNFSDFIGDADFTQINSISFTLGAARNAVDASLSMLYFGSTQPAPAPVPLPAAAGLLGAALGGLGLVARRRRT